MGCSTGGGGGVTGRGGGGGRDPEDRRAACGCMTAEGELPTGRVCESGLSGGVDLDRLQGLTAALPFAFGAG